ncbi:A1pp-domain-containing protein [Neocallimastix lanati (nom. inval.)]|jgi:O-acetyl-ADP-ribose deacetylase (regulator of RNase III)|uniref:A1pp-domain-containing protein n=1 Tax=Neocallimastix californiae TaxID=1754190 RepID=A0A1Y2D9R9_9FUNG|nr:A1pp-domain-containing protein [Neocallimastix sp. JGI-2020a]ORY56003.1 A1pp-domain-containing protein [Neocallimastix californiae]|eukprot:ORY56003.1 A1pp-domain-containing protein [Neocallimastix californiae]
MEKLNSQINFLIDYLLKEASEIVDYKDENFKNKFSLYKSLCNIRQPYNISNEFLEKEKEFFTEYNKTRNIQEVDSIKPLGEAFPNITNQYKNKLVLWQGDITTLKADAIVNAANSQGLGCFVPSHICIDNLIHTYAGVALRLECNEVMKKIDYNLETGKAIITSAQNLPSKYVLHTVGPIIQSRVSESKINDLANCYRNCLKLAQEHSIKSIAFPCISTGLFRFPQALACEIAIKTTIEYLDTHDNNFEKIIFNVFGDKDLEIYREYIQKNL